MGIGLVLVGSRDKTYTLVLGMGLPMDNGYPVICGWTVLQMDISVGPQQLLKSVCWAHLSASALDDY